MTNRADPSIATSLAGRYVKLEPFNEETASLGAGEHLCGSKNGDLWKFIPLNCPETNQQLVAMMQFTAANLGWITYAIKCSERDMVVGMASLMGIRAEHRSAEVGCVVFGKEMQRTPLGTETIFLLASHLFDDLKYRRFEWKCDNLNKASKSAALRFGFEYEGLFRKDMIVNGRNRDTAWFAMIDDRWNHIRQAYNDWLSPDNFTNAGQQKSGLSQLVNS